MAFKSKAENGGVIDENINTKGRIKSNRERSRRSIREQELINLLRKIKPHLTESITTAATIMKNKDASHMNQLKAATILLNAYKEIVNDVYDGVDKDEEGTEVQPTAPVFSLTVIKPEEKDKE